MADGQFPVAAVTRKDFLRMLVTVVLAVLALVASITWPAYGYVFWAMFIVMIAASLYNALKKPVNYDALVISEQAIEYAVGTFCKAIRFEDIESLKFVREQALFDDLTGPYIESKWAASKHGVRVSGPATHEEGSSRRRQAKFECRSTAIEPAR